jgi:hypothetical protein
LAGRPSNPALGLSSLLASAEFQDAGNSKVCADAGPAVKLTDKVKLALDENRMVILGAQVLLGFHLQGVFQESFAALPHDTRLIECLGQVLMVLAIGLLIAPSMQHRIVERGQDTLRIHRVAGFFAGLALIPFGVSLGLSVYVVFDHLFSRDTAVIAGATFFLAAGCLWFGAGFGIRFFVEVQSMAQHQEETPLVVKIDQMLTEARVVLPGAQALLGFQLTVTLTHAFEQLPMSARLVHVVALSCVAVATILLMTPAALHRISFGGEESPMFFRLGSAFVIAAPVPLALGIVGDLYVAVSKAAESPILALIAAGVMFYDPHDPLVFIAVQSSH